MLYWESSYEIVLRLIEEFPNADIDSVGTDQLFQWIVALPDFADDPALANEGILNGILRDWYEEVGSR
ncbi:MAG: Fe-S cluster assembly protein IscX [Chloroflexi bacterium]|nr:Fe-S cluster assembly protein IscX [Chloroflexota bacterium]